MLTPNLQNLPGVWSWPTRRKSQLMPGGSKAGGITVTSDAVLLDLKIGLGAEFLDQLIRRKTAAAIATKRVFSCPMTILKRRLPRSMPTAIYSSPNRSSNGANPCISNNRAIRDYVVESALWDVRNRN